MAIQWLSARLSTAPQAKSGRRWLASLRARLTMLTTDIRYWKWHRSHPTDSYGDFYAATVTRRLDSGKSHRTLGKRQWTRDADSGMPSWSATSFNERGEDQVRLLLQLGLKPQDRCIDYGCGSLRLGQHLMRLLQPGHYCGIDVTDRFYRDGLTFIDPALVTEKRPDLGVIEPTNLARLAQNPPDFLFSYAVLKHVPPAELPRYFSNLAQLIGRRTKAVVFFTEGPAQRRTSNMSWAYPGEMLRDLLLRAHPDLKVVIQRLTHGQQAERPDLGHSVLHITGRDVSVDETVLKLTQFIM